MIKKQLGFSLLEMAVVIITIALIAAPALNFLGESKDIAARKSTANKLDAIKQALTAYYQSNNNTLPCPAPLTNFTGTADSASNCSNTNQIAGGAIVHGAFPSATLNLPETYLVDNWDRRLEYYVTTAATVTANTAGNIKVLNVDINSGGDPEDAVLVILSHGKDGLGAYKKNSSSQDSSTGANSNELTNVYDGNNGNGDVNSLAITRDKAQGDISLSITHNDLFYTNLK
jgi:type II secretory pathway pseudopilin PulG